MLPMLVLTAVAIAPIDYTVAVTPGPTVTVTMTLTGRDTGETKIDLPSKWAGSDRLWQALGTPAVENGTLVPGEPGHWRIRHRPLARVTIRYSVADGQPGVPDAATFEKARPVIERDWLSIRNQGAIAIPRGHDGFPARFTLAPPPPGWQLASDLTAPGRALTVGDVAEGVIVAGSAMRLSTRTVGGRTVRVAVIGQWPFSDAAFADPVARLVATENAALAAPPIDYLVTLTPLAGSATGAMSHGGTGAVAGFAMEATDNIPLHDLTRTIAHEYAHRWFGRGFGPNEDSARGYLFSEGFNDWFAHRAMVASGLWTPRQWADQLDLVLLRYGSSIARGLSEAEIIAKFWENPDAMQLQYDRGNLTALLLDAHLRAAGRPGLVPLLRDMATAQGDERTRIEHLADAALPGAFAESAGEAMAALPADAVAACGTLGWVEQPAYGRGFEIDGARRVTTVEPGSGAAKAGIAPGMTYVRRVSFAYLDSAAPYVAEFAEGGTVRTIHWLPTLPRTVRFQRLIGSAIDTPACRTAIAGSPATP